MGKSNSECGTEQESMEQELEMEISDRTAEENQRQTSTSF